MRYIVKQEPPPEFVALADTKGANWNDSATGPVRRATRMRLSNEQFGLCAYCCSSLPTPPQSEGTEDLRRVAHIIPQSVDGEKSLQWENVVLSCSSGRTTIEQPTSLEQTCDEAQKSSSVLVSPLSQNCETRFRFFSSGKVAPRDPNDYDVTETIKVLNLDSKRLTSARRAAIETASDLVTQSPNPGEERTLLLQPKSGTLPEFEPALRQLV